MDTEDVFYDAVFTSDSIQATTYENLVSIECYDGQLGTSIFLTKEDTLKFANALIALALCV